MGLLYQWAAARAAGTGHDEPQERAISPQERDIKPQERAISPQERDISRLQPIESENDIAFTNKEHVFNMFLVTKFRKKRTQPLPGWALASAARF